MQIAAPLNCDPTPRLQTIEVSSTFQLPGFHIVGLPSREVAEARERVRAAITAEGFEFPRRRVLLNLSPADIHKRGTGMDLAIALSVLCAADDSAPSAGPVLVVASGELGLDGRVKPVGQTTRALYAAWEAGADVLVLAREEAAVAAEALSLIRGCGHGGTLAQSPHAPPAVLPVERLSDAWNALQSGKFPDAETAPASKASRLPRGRNIAESAADSLLPLSPALERSVCIAAAGGHHLMMLGPKGAGKSHATEWLVHLLPPSPPRIRLTHRLMSELRASHSIREASGSTDTEVPIRRISIATRPAALVGHVTESVIRPGELTLAHGGLVIADEFPEWSRDSRECLREPLEAGRIVVTRARGAVVLPARFLFVANGNLCPCGGLPSAFLRTSEGVSPCECAPHRLSAYRTRLSGPILDRIDLVTIVQPDTGPPRDRPHGPSRVSILKERVAETATKAVARYGARPGLLEAVELEHLLEANPAWRSQIETLGGLSLRARHKLLRVALTAALWDGLPAPGPAQFAEAALYRSERILKARVT